MNLLFFDIEWANSKNKSICQIGLLIEDYLTKEPIYPERNIYVNPDDGFDYFCTAIHKITSDKVKNEPTFNIIWKDIYKYFYKSIIVGHNVASADLDGLIKNLQRYKIDIPDFYYIDTLEIAKRCIAPYEIKNYSLDTLCEYFEIDFDTHHDAFDDACMTNDLLNCLIKEYGLNINKLIKHYDYQTINTYTKFLSNPEIRNNIYELLGHILGFEMDTILPIEEVEYLQRWYDKYKDVKSDDSLNNIITILKEILIDNVVTLNEIHLLKNSLNTYVQLCRGNEITIGTQLLKNIVLGIKEDGVIVDKEIYELQKWLYKNDYLKNNYPYDKICEIVNKVIEDGVISEEEKKEVINTIDKLYNPLANIETSIIIFEEKSFCLSGDFKYGSKAMVGNYIIKKGGLVHDIVKKTTDYVVVGELGSLAYSNGNYGSKVKKAKEWNILVIKEEQLFR